MAEKRYKFIRKDGEVLCDELGKQAKASKEAEEIFNSIQEFTTDNKKRKGKEKKQTARKLNGELAESDDKLSDTRSLGKDESSELEHEMIEKVIEAFKDGPLVWTPCINNASDSQCNVTGRSSYIEKETVNENGFKVDRRSVYETDGSVDVKASSASNISIFNTNLAEAEFNCNLEGTLKTREERFSDLKSANGREGNIKVAELKGKADASSEIKAFKWKGKLEAEAEMDISGNASFVGADIKTVSDSDEFKAQFKIGHADADFKGHLNASGSAGHRCAKIDANAKGEVELNLVEGGFSHKSKCDIQRISHNERQNTESRSSWKNAIEINAEAKSGGQIKFCHLKGSLNSTYKKKTSSGENKSDDQNRSFDLTVADGDFAQDSKCEIKGAVSYDKQKSEKGKNWKRETSINAKVEGNMEAKSKGHARLNVFETAVAKIGYNATFEGKGKAEFKGHKSKTTYKQNGHEKLDKFCVASTEGKAQGEADLSADVNILNCKAKLGVEGKFEGEAKTNFKLAKIKTKQTNGKITREFDLMQGKAEGKCKANAKAYIGKHNAGFDAEAEGEAELTLASGKADFNVKKNKNGYTVPGVNFTLGQAAARGRAKCDLNADIDHKKWQKKYDISGEARVSALNVQAFGAEVNREKDHGSHTKKSVNAELARVHLMNLKVTGKETGNATQAVSDFKGLEANIGNVSATGVDDRETVDIKTSSGLKANIGNIQATAIGPKRLKMEHDGGAGIDCFNVQMGIHRTAGVSVATNRQSFCNLNLTIGPPQLNLNMGNCGFNFGIPFFSDGGGGGATGGGGCENNDGENNANIKDKGESRKGDGNKGRQLGGNFKDDSDSLLALSGNEGNYDSTSKKIGIPSGESGTVIDRINRERITNAEGHEYWNTGVDSDCCGGIDRMTENGSCIIGEVGMGGNWDETWEDTEDVSESDFPFSNKSSITGKTGNEVAYGSDDTLRDGFEECDGEQENTCKYQSGTNLMEPEEYNKYLKSLVDQKISTHKQPDSQRETTSSLKESGQCYWSNTERVRSDIFKQYTGKSEKEIKGKSVQLEEVRKYQQHTSDVQSPRKRQSEHKKPFGSNKNIHTIFTLNGGDSKPIQYIKNNVACFGD